MAVPVARVHLAMAHAALPPLLPTPPKSKMLPLLPTPPRVVLPVSPPKISRADSDERWDAHKIKPATASPAALGQRSTDGKTGSPWRASSCERWDTNKKSAASSSSSSGISSASTRASASSKKWESNKRPVSVSRASSAARWDAHKKPRPLQGDVLLVDDGEISTGSNDVEMDDKPPQRALYAGPGFVASPEPSMIPMPAFLVRVA